MNETTIYQLFEANINRYKNVIQTNININNKQQTVVKHF